MQNRNVNRWCARNNLQWKERERVALGIRQASNIIALYMYKSHTYDVEKFNLSLVSRAFSRGEKKQKKREKRIKEVYLLGQSSSIILSLRLLNTHFSTFMWCKQHRTGELWQRKKEPKKERVCSSMCHSHTQSRRERINKTFVFDVEIYFSLFPSSGRLMCVGAGEIWRLSLFYEFEVSFSSRTALSLEAFFIIPTEPIISNYFCLTLSILHRPGAVNTHLRLSLKVSWFSMCRPFSAARVRTNYSFSAEIWWAAYHRAENCLRLRRFMDNVASLACSNFSHNQIAALEMSECQRMSWAFSNS